MSSWLSTRARRAACVLACLAATGHAGATSLVEAWRAAQQNDAGYAAARAAAAAGEAQQGRARALGLPSVSLAAGVGRATAEADLGGAQLYMPGLGTTRGVSLGTSVTSGTLGSYMLSARQPLWNRQLQAQRRQLSLGAEAADIELELARQQLVVEVAGRYFDVVVAEETARLLKQQHAAVERAQRDMRQRDDGSDIPIVDSHEAAARWAAIGAELLAVEADLQVKQAAFTDLTGVPARGLRAPGAGVAATRLAPLAKWQADIARDNPRLRMQAKNREATQQEAKKFDAMAAPALDLVAQVGRDRLSGDGAFGPATNDARNRMIGLQLTIPLYTGGMRSAQRDEALALADKAVAEGAQLEKQVALQARAAWLGISAGARRVTALEATDRATRARLEATRVGRGAGDRTTLDLLNAESDAMAVQLSLLQARVALALDRLRLAALAGQLGEEDLLQLDRTLQR